MYEDITLDNSVPFPPYPGTPLRVGSSGVNVAWLQTGLNAVRAQLYPKLTYLTVDGKFGNATKTTVMQYQAIKGLKIDGIVGSATWNALKADYDSLPLPPPDVYPGVPLTYGSTGPAVLSMEVKINELIPTYTSLIAEKLDGVFGPDMAHSTVLFQKQFGLNPDGVIGKQTWDKIVSVHAGVKAGTSTKVTTAYPGIPYAQGSTGDAVRYIQSYMNTVNIKNSYGWPIISVDGSFGSATNQLVKQFQAKYGLKIDGVVGSKTWAVMVPEYNKIV